MTQMQRYILGAALGCVVGLLAAVISVRASALGNMESIGPWRTGRDFGSQQAGAYTRAVVALYGLLALPASEARYYTAATDNRGAPLDGRCQYTISGGQLPAKWWSLTLYDHDGYLIDNRSNLYSVSSIELPLAEQSHWTVTVSPHAQPGHWLPSGTNREIALTLRTYLPDGDGRHNLNPSQLPQIVKEQC